jgi:hypothetical protein
MDARELARRIRSDEEGITLVELLVVLLAGTVVALGLFAFQDVTLRQSTRVFANVDATQRARTTMELIETRLRSSCVSENVTPILPGTGNPGSTDTSLAFVSKFGSAASLTPEKHVISLDTTTGVLTDSTYSATGGTAPNWTFSTTASSSRKLLDHVTQVGTTPLFRYYKYGIAGDSSGNQYLDAAGNPFMILLDGTATLPTGVTTAAGGSVPQNTIPYNSAADRGRLVATPPIGLSTADAKLVSAVTITMRVGAAGKLGDYGDNRALTDDTTLQDSVVLRLTPVPSEGNLPTVPPCA